MHPCENLDAVALQWLLDHGPDPNRSVKRGTALEIDCISVGVDRMQRNFEPMRTQVEAWQRSELTDVRRRVVILTFVEGKLEAPKHLHVPFGVATRISRPGTLAVHE